MRPDYVYCEMCGSPVRRREAKIVYIEGARLVLCPYCYAKVAKRAVAAEVKELTRPKIKRPPVRSAPAKRSPPRKMLDDLEVVPDYANRIRKARERLGWSQRVLAEAIGESENVIKRMEAGRLTPSIDQARRLEKVLNIKLLEPIVDSEPASAFLSGGISKDLTLGDIASIRKKGERR